VIDIKVHPVQKSQQGGSGHIAWALHCNIGVQFKCNDILLLYTKSILSGDDQSALGIYHFYKYLT